MEQLFDGHDDLFRAAIAGIRTYGEYGLGASTLWMDRHSYAQIIGVDTDPDWAKQTCAALTRAGHDIRHVDVGPVAKWGKPRSYRKRRAFIDYIEGPWLAGPLPQVVLIDGRFRVACFLTSLMLSEPGTVIIFDDYITRRTYHLVEEMLAPAARNARQASFIVPTVRNRTAIKRLRDQFVMVIE